MDVPYSSVVCKHPASEHGTIAGEEQWTAAKITKVAAHTAINSRLECLVDMRPTTLRSNVALLRVCRIEELNAESKGVKGPVAAWSRVLGYPETFRFMKNYLGSMINIEGRGDVLVTRISRSQRLPGKGTIINANGIRRKVKEIDRTHAIGGSDMVGILLHAKDCVCKK